MPNNNLIYYVSTRWNSTFYLIDRLLEQHWPITAVPSDSSVTKVSDRTLDLTTDQWNLLASLNPVLHVLQVATTYSSTENNVSTCISAVFSIVHGLTKSMEITEDDPPAIYLNVISVRKVREGGNLMNSM